MDTLPIIATVLVAAVGQFSLLWWRIGRIEGRVNGKIDGSYFKCPFFRPGHKRDG